MSEDNPMSGINGRIDRRKFIKSIAGAGGSGIGFSAISSSATAKKNSTTNNVPSEYLELSRKFQKLGDIPGISLEQTVGRSNVCYVSGVSCALVPTPAGTLAAKVCGLSGSSCAALETLERLGCGGDIKVYSVGPPLPPAPALFIPECLDVNPMYAAYRILKESEDVVLTVGNLINYCVNANNGPFGLPSGCGILNIPSFPGLNPFSVPTKRTLDGRATAPYTGTKGDTSQSVSTGSGIELSYKHDAAVTEEFVQKYGAADIANRDTIKVVEL